MKYLLGVIAIALIGFVGFLVLQGTGFIAGDDGRVRVAATIFPLVDIVQNVGGDRVNVQTVLPPGASPHTFEFTPRQLQQLQGSEIIFAIGHGLDDWALLAHEAIPGSEVVFVDQGIHIRETEDDHHHGHEDYHEDDHHEDEHREEHHEDEHHDDHGHEHGPTDPHYWLHFGNAQVIADTVAAELSRIDPENATYYHQNAQEYQERLIEKAQELAELTDQLDRREMLTLHDAWYYFAENFGLHIIGTFEPAAGEEPSPQYLVALLREMREHDIRAIFSEPQLHGTALETFAADNNLEIVVLDPIGGIEGRDSYIELMEYNVRTAYEALAQ